MSASHETFEYHLTPNGWIEGTCTYDFAKTVEKPVPADRVATFVEDQYIGSVFSKLQVSWQQRWIAPDADLQPLYKAFGQYPQGVEESLHRHR